MNTRLAFASTDGKYIDQHFGSARIFQIFEVSSAGYRLVDSRQTEGYCRGHCEGGFAHLLEALADCSGIFVSRIGEGAAAFMIQHGKRVFEASGPVDDVIKQVVADGLWEEE
jgi:predicted Fe-Mo cluster-binding NifX family protein